MNKTTNVARAIFAVVFISGAIANLIMLITTPEIYAGFASDALLPIYKQGWDYIVYPNLVAFVGIVILFELLLAFLLSAKGKLARMGFWFAAGFMLALFPFWWYGTSLMNLALAIGFLWFSRYPYPLSLPEWIGELIHSKRR